MACAISLLLGAAANPAAAVERPERGAWQAPRPPDVDPEDPATQLERLKALEERDPAGFRDLLRRSLAARILWAASGRELPPDMPIELAGP